MHQQDGKRQCAPDVRDSDRIQGAVRIARPVDRRIDQAEGEKYSVQETELETVDERPDETIGDRWHCVRQQNQQASDPRGPNARLVDEQRNGDAQNDLCKDRDACEQESVLEREPEQSIVKQANVVLQADKWEFASAQLSEPDAVQ